MVTQFFLFGLLCIIGPALGENHHIRQSAPRLRAKSGFSTLEATLRVFKNLETHEEDGQDAFTEWMDSLTVNGLMSMDTNVEPPIVITDSPSVSPTSVPSKSPTLSPTTFTPFPTISAKPSILPTESFAPSPSEPVPTALPTSLPSMAPSKLPTELPTPGPSTQSPTESPTSSPTSSPSTEIISITTNGPTNRPTTAPTKTPSVSPTAFPSAAPTTSPTLTPTVEGCTVSADVRVAQIMALLDSVASPAMIRNSETPQGQATNWLLDEDPRKLCPDSPKIVQRWVLAVMYFSTGGDNWFQCSNSLFADDACGSEEPFDGQQRFLSGFHECDWAGIDCDDLECVNKIEFELNNLEGTIPTELGLLSDLEFIGMERGRLFGTIPTEMAELTKLSFLDLDFNQLTGSLSSQLLSLSSLTQLDLNNNLLTGPINGIGVFPDMVWLQLHDNRFTGTVPSGVGDFSNLLAFTLHETDISGVMPQSVCNLLGSNGGALTSLIADCQGGNADIECGCCTDCRN